MLLLAILGSSFLIAVARKHVLEHNNRQRRRLNAIRNCDIYTYRNELKELQAILAKETNQ